MISKFKHPQRLLFSTASRHLSSSCHPFKTQQSSNDLISHLCKQKRFSEALQAFDTLRSEFPLFHLYPSTYAHLLHAASSLHSLRHTLLVHRHISASQTPSNVVLHNHILTAYGKCGALDDALRLFDAMPEKNLVSWSAMISGFSQGRRELEAVGFYLGLLRAGFFPDKFSLGNVVRASSGLGDLELGKQLHGHLLKLDSDPDLLVSNALVMMYSKCDRADCALVLFERIKEKDLVSWGSMIASLAQQGRELEALLLFKEMFGTGVHHPNEFHFGSAFSACGILPHLDFGEQLHGLCVKYGLESDEHAGCSLSDMYARCGSLDCAKKAFYQIEMPDMVSWNSIIGAFANGGFISEVMLFFLELSGLGLQPDGITVRCLLCTCTSPASFFQGRLFHCYVVKMGFENDIAVCNSLLAMYSKCSDLTTTFALFEEMKSNKDIISWNTIFTACLQHKQPEEIFCLSKAMFYSNKKVDRITLSSMLSASAYLGYLETTMQIHGYALKDGLESDVVVRNSLIDAYAKCGSLEDGRKLFELVRNDCDVFSWSSLIVGYAQFGYGKEALELFKEMQSLGVKPNQISLVGVLTACSRDGLVREGLFFYERMESEYGIAPTREHCSCVVDLLARAGRLSEAERFIGQMAFEPDIVMWKTLLAACSVYKNVDIGKRVAERILKMDPSNSTAHVLLCNIFASSNCWDDVMRLRKLMRSHHVRKSPGKSWIKVKGTVRIFVVADRSHPETDDIYVMLDLLWLEMTEARHAST